MSIFHNKLTAVSEAAASMPARSRHPPPLQDLNNLPNSNRHDSAAHTLSGTCEMSSLEALRVEHMRLLEHAASLHSESKLARGDGLDSAPPVMVSWSREPCATKSVKDLPHQLADFRGTVVALDRGLQSVEYPFVNNNSAESPQGT